MVQAVASFERQTKHIFFSYFLLDFTAVKKIAKDKGKRTYGGGTYGGADRATWEISMMKIKLNN